MGRPRGPYATCSRFRCRAPRAPAGQVTHGIGPRQRRPAGFPGAPGSPRRLSYPGGRLALDREIPHRRRTAMAQRRGYADGEPCWADVTTPDLEAGKRFYGTVFGWEFQDTGPDFGHYTMALKDGNEVAAITPPMAGAESAPAAWNTYLASSDAAATAARVEANGGKILMGPMEIQGSGHM